MGCYYDLCYRSPSLSLSPSVSFFETFIAFCCSSFPSSFSASSDNLSRVEVDQQERMEFFQEPTFAAFLALVLTVLVAKLVSLVVNNSSAGGDSVVCSVNGGAVAKKDVILDGGLRVRSTKGKKRVKFVDEVVIKRVNRYEGSENLVLLDDVDSVGEVTVEGKSVDEKALENVDQFGESEDSGGEMTKKQCFDVREMDDGEAQKKGSEKMEMLIEKGCDGDNMDADFGGQEKTSDKGSENVEMLIEKEYDGDNIDDGVFNEKEKTSVTDVEEQKNEVELESDDMKIDQKEGNGLVGSGENEGLVTGDVEEKEKEGDESVDDEDDEWEGIERSELEKIFAEAVNYLEYGGKGKDKNDDWLAKLSSDVQMQLYGLHKVAVEGPCHEPQPMALKVSARAKWYLILLHIHICHD